MYSVSDPQPLLLVWNTGEDNHERTLVVPDLPRVKLAYFRCLVDAGASFVEQAVILLGDDEMPQKEREIVERALSAARPTTVSFVRGGVAENSAGHSPAEPARAAAAVCARLDLDAQQQDSLGFRVLKEGKFFLCEVLDPS